MKIIYTILTCLVLAFSALGCAGMRQNAPLPDMVQSVSQPLETITFNVEKHSQINDIFDIADDRQEAQNYIENIKNEIIEYLTPEQIELLYKYSNLIDKSITKDNIERTKKLAEYIYLCGQSAKTAQESLVLENELDYTALAEPIIESENYTTNYYQDNYEEDYNDYAPSYSSGSTSNFKRDGVIYQDGYRYTYYSSNVAHHYRTNEWTPGDDGVYRTDEGYVVVASDDDNYGDIVSTPFGDGIVLDSGAGSGTRDIYTNY